ncbi:bacterial alpha-L-rhamnosidase-domain-containing protein [Leptodontidium sp. 2 PMI_412]|nr:bacterial alpha-L-rhamnosidase-domain-containing protein [Leptodontidium sp. 2 PMI_412]
MSASIAQITAEHHYDGFGLFTSSPRLSWRFNDTSLKNWKQASYEIKLTRQGREEHYQVSSSQSVLVPWPSTPLSSRENASIKIFAKGQDGSSTAWESLDVEVALLDRADLKATLISRPRQDPAHPKAPFCLRRTFNIVKSQSARLYTTAHGIYEVEINGKKVGDQLLTPGWQSYKHRLHYQTYDVTHLLQEGSNTIGASIGEGCTSGRRVEILNFPSAELIAPDVAPVRKIQEFKPREIITTPKGKTVLDFGQNLVGWLRFDNDAPGQSTQEPLIRHAEVLEHGELGTRPLRSARAELWVKLGGRTKGYEPKFTWFGFRYAEVNGYDNLSVDDFTAIAISSDLRRTGTFSSSHELINKLHENTVWSMRDNFRLGWTGDIQVFAPTANYLFDTSAFLGGWLRNLAAEQSDQNGVVPWVIPSVPFEPGNRQNRPAAIWADCAVITPWDMYRFFGDKSSLELQWESMRGFWTTEFPQFGDWLGPRAPPAFPGYALTDPFLVANAYLIYTTNLAAQIGRIIGKSEKAEEFVAQSSKLLALFQEEYVTATGRLVSDTQTGHVLALRFGLLPEKHLKRASDRLDWLVRWEVFKITTGFAGTPIILQTLADNDKLNLAYHMLEEKEDPSWLYPITMGATTIWERWNSMLPDGTINPDQMTSFNHYALGSVCAFLHNTVGGTIRHASTSFDSPYGLYAVSWKTEGSQMVTEVTVPPNGSAKVILPGGVDEVVGSGKYKFTSAWEDEKGWPPAHIQGAQGAPRKPIA